MMPLAIEFSTIKIILTISVTDSVSLTMDWFWLPLKLWRKNYRQWGFCTSPFRKWCQDCRVGEYSYVWANLEKEVDEATKKLKAKDVFPQTCWGEKDVDDTVVGWRPLCDKAVEKMKASFPICTEHLEIYHPFIGEIHPFFEKFEPASLADFFRDKGYRWKNYNWLWLDKEYCLGKITR